MAEFKFVDSVKIRKSDRSWEFKGNNIQRSTKGKERRDKLADDMVSAVTNSPSFEEAKKALFALIGQALVDGMSRMEYVRMCFNLEQIDELDELVRYAYNFKLRASGLSVHRVIRGK